MATQAQNYSAYIRKLSFVVTTLLLDLTLSVGREQEGIENGQEHIQNFIKRLEKITCRSDTRWLPHKLSTGLQKPS